MKTTPKKKPARGAKTQIVFVGQSKNQERRDATSPLRNLTPQQAAFMFESYARGDFASLQWLYAAPFTGIECSDPDYLAIIERRLSAIKEMNWQIVRWKPSPDSPGPDDKAMDGRARAQESALLKAYNAIGNLYEAISFLELSRFRGFSILEKTPGELLPVNHWNVRRDGSRGAWYWNEKGITGVPLRDCQELPPEKIIAMESARPVGRFAALKFIRANLSEQEWDSFIEIYGIPSGVVIAPEGVNSTNIEEFKTSAANVARGADAAFPHGSEYIPNDKSRGTQPFQPRLEWLTQKLILAGTGGLLTMLTMSGSGTLAGSAHMEAFKILARGDARDISEAMQRQYDLPLLAAAGLVSPGEQPLAWFELSAREEQSPEKATEQAIKLGNLFELDPAQVQERTGWKVKARPAAPPSTVLLQRAEGGGIAHRAPGTDPAFPDDSDIEQAAAALLADLEPVREAFGAALRACGGDLKKAVLMMEKDLPRAAASIKEGALDEFLESNAAEAMVEMFAEIAAGKGGKK